MSYLPVLVSFDQLTIQAVIYGIALDQFSCVKSCMGNFFRKQIELTPNFSKKMVTLKQLGGTPSFVGEKGLKKGETASLYDGDILYLVQKHFPHRIEFIDKNG